MGKGDYKRPDPKMNVTPRRQDISWREKHSRHARRGKGQRMQRVIPIVMRAKLNRELLRGARNGDTMKVLRVLNAGAFVDVREGKEERTPLMQRWPE